MRPTAAKSIVKYLVGQSLIRTGLWNRLLRTWARRNEAIILTYHRVIEKWDRTLDYAQPGMVVTAETFNRQLAFLKDQFAIVPLSSLIAERSIDRLSGRPPCAITFDDGWCDNYEIAFPILRTHGVPATIFLTTDFIGTNRVFWHTELIYLLLHGKLPRLTRLQRRFQSYPAPARWPLMQFARMRQSLSADDVDSFIDTVKHAFNEDTIEDLIRDVADAMGLHRPLLPGRRFFLDWDQVCKMAAAGIEIGSHGCSHRVLTRLKAEEAEEELIRSREKIEGHIGRRVQHFAFPDGAANSNLIALAGKVGYRTTCLCASDRDEGGVTSLTLRRVGMHEGASTGWGGSFSGVSLLLWLFRASRMRRA